MRFMLYLTAGIPTAAQFSIKCVHHLDFAIAVGIDAKHDAWSFSATSIGVEESGSWIMSSSMPKELTCSRQRARSSLRPSVSVTFTRVVANIDDTELRPLSKVYVVSRSNLCAYSTFQSLRS